MGNSTLDPNWKGTPAPKEDWMSLSEYLSLCKDVGMMPLVGVNYNCKGEEWVPLNESIARAVRQVNFVKAAGFEGALYYIGNEDGAPRHSAGPGAGGDKSTGGAALSCVVVLMAVRALCP